MELTFQVAGLDKIKRWVLSFGPEAVVLEPEKLKEMVRKHFSRNLAQYSTRSITMNSMKEMEYDDMHHKNKRLEVSPSWNSQGAFGEMW